MQKFMQGVKKICCEWWKRALICFIAAVILSVGLEWLQIKTQPKNYYYEEGEVQGEFTLPLEEANLIVCERVDSHVQVEGGPAEIQFFPDGSKTFNRVSVSFYEPAESSGVMRVLYAAGEEDCTVDASLQLPFDPGMDHLDFIIPGGNYNKIKVQIAGNIGVQGVQASSIEHQRIAVDERLSIKRIAMLTFFLFCVFLFFFGIHGWTKFRESVQQGIRDIRENRKKVIIRIAISVVAIVLTYFALRAYVPYFLNKPFNWVLRLFCIATSIAVGSLFCFTRALGSKPEIFFVIICLLSGMFIAIFSPAATTVSWDDGYHYLNASKYSYLGQTRLTEQDNIALAAWSERVYDLSAVDEWHSRQDELYQKGVTNLQNGMINPKNFWLFFPGIGLYLGRVLGFPFHRIWEMGRLFSLIAYAVIGYFAIRRLKSGKMILAGVLLIPECIFLAATYSYDPGVIAFLALGLSYSFAEWQEPQKTMKGFNAVVILAALFLGCLTKYIYFPVFFIPLLLPAKKFKNKASHRAFVGATILMMLYLIWSFASPYLGGNASENTDSRVFSDADAGRQIPYILENPLTYTGILLRALRSVLGPENSEGLFTFFAYMGKAPNNYMYVAILAILAFTDKTEDDYELSKRGWTRLFFEVLMFGIACLAATSMYIVFTPVAADHIEGFQYRYTLPIIYPAIMLLGSGKIVNRSNRTIYNGLMFAAIGFVDFSAVLISFCALYS